VSPVDDQYLEVGLLRSLEWMSEQSVSTAGDRTVLNLPEMGAKGDFQVVSIDPCQIVLGDQGRRITGIFRHRRGLVYDLSITGTSDLVRVTRLHPIWSVDREDWIAMKDLLVGERLLTSTGTATVLDLVERGEEPVFNLEVDADHCYRVGEQGILVHNASDPCCRIDDGTGTPGPYAALENTDDPDIKVTASRMFDPRQKVNILNANEMRNGGMLRSDDPADPAPLLVRPIPVNPQTFPKPSKPRDANGFLNEAQVDHINPFVVGGSNSYCNARLISQELNIRKRHGKA